MENQNEGRAEKNTCKERAGGRLLFSFTAYARTSTVIVII
jgi:hypothetical protein